MDILIPRNAAKRSADNEGLKHHSATIGKPVQYETGKPAPATSELGEPGAAPNRDQAKDEAAAGIERGQQNAPERSVDSVSHS